MISYEQAKKTILEAGQACGCKTETIALQDSVKRVCAQDLVAPLDVQPFDNSAMDGFALRREDLAENGGVLTQLGLIVAGDTVPDNVVQAGFCVEIMTGAPVPPQANAVVPVELVERYGDQIRFKYKPKMGANIRYAGEDFKKGMTVLKAGQIIHPQHIMPLATLGIDKLTVYKKPRAVLLTTGSELVEDLSQGLQSGQIYNSNSPYGIAALEAMGVELISVVMMPDEPERFSTLLKDIEKLNVDFLISSGAVSAGKFDFVRQGLEQAGADILFHKVAIKPGKPNLFAHLQNNTLYFGLPGNPVATAAGLRFFVQPCIHSMMNMDEEVPVRAQAVTDFKKRAGLRMFLKAKAIAQENGMFGIEILEGQNSFQVHPFLEMNCWAIASEDAEEVGAGDLIDLYPLYPHGGFL